jgi:hypothetical protein
MVMEASMVAAVGNFSQAAVLTFAIPIGTLVLAIGIAFYQRKPLPNHRRAQLFPLSAIPQRSYDLALLAALNERDRQQLKTDQAETQPGAERPIGGG